MVLGQRVLCTTWVWLCGDDGRLSASRSAAFNFRKAPPPIPPGSQAPPRISITAQSSTDSAHESFTAAEGPARRCSSADGLDGPTMGARTLELAPVPPRASPKPPTLIIKTIPGREELRSLARQRKWRPSIGVQVWLTVIAIQGCGSVSLGMDGGNQKGLLHTQTLTNKHISLGCE